MQQQSASLVERWLQGDANVHAAFIAFGEYCGGCSCTEEEEEEEAPLPPSLMKQPFFGPRIVDENGNVIYDDEAEGKTKKRARDEEEEEEEDENGQVMVTFAPPFKRARGEEGEIDVSAIPGLVDDMVKEILRRLLDDAETSESRFTLYYVMAQISRRMLALVGHFERLPGETTVKPYTRHMGNQLLLGVSELNLVPMLKHLYLFLITPQTYLTAGFNFGRAASAANESDATAQEKIVAVRGFLFDNAPFSYGFRVGLLHPARPLQSSNLFWLGKQFSEFELQKPKCTYMLDYLIGLIADNHIDALTKLLDTLRPRDHYDNVFERTCIVLETVADIGYHTGLDDTTRGVSADVGIKPREILSRIAMRVPVERFITRLSRESPIVFADWINYQCHNPTDGGNVLVQIVRHLEAPVDDALAVIGDRLGVAQDANFTPDAFKALLQELQRYPEWEEHIPSAWMHLWKTDKLKILLEIYPEPDAIIVTQRIREDIDHYVIWGIIQRVSELPLEEQRRIVETNKPLWRRIHSNLVDFPATNATGHRRLTLLDYIITSLAMCARLGMANVTFDEIDDAMLELPDA
jgi:hypothetical protein